MKKSFWQVAEAKASFSALLDSASDHPQIVRKRSKPVVVVMSFERYQEIEAAMQPAAQRQRTQDFLDAAAKVRAEGGLELGLPERVPRRSPFQRRGR